VIKKIRFNDDGMWNQTKDLAWIECVLAKLSFSCTSCDVLEKPSALALLDSLWLNISDSTFLRYFVLKTSDLA
jgi:hypothetical protein